MKLWASVIAALLVAFTCEAIDSVSPTEKAYLDYWYAKSAGTTRWDEAYVWVNANSNSFSQIELDIAAINARTSLWDTAYSWGDHSTNGYLTSETDPIFTAWLATNVQTVGRCQISAPAGATEAMAANIFEQLTDGTTVSVSNGTWGAVTASNITIAVNGDYRVRLSGASIYSVNVAMYEFQIRTNAVVVPGMATAGYWYASLPGMGMGCGGIVTLSAGDTVEAWGKNQKAGTMTWTYGYLLCVEGPL